MMAAFLILPVPGRGTVRAANGGGGLPLTVALVESPLHHACGMVPLPAARGGIGS